MRYSRVGYWGSVIGGTALCLLGAAAIVEMSGGVSWTKGAVLSVVGLVSAAIALSAYRYTDEVQARTQKAAWFWGSIVGTVATIPLMVTLGWKLVTVPDWLLPERASHQLIFVEGMAFLWLVQGAAFLLVRSWQQLSGRA